MLGYCQSCRKHVELAASPNGGRHSCIHCGTPITVPSVNQLNTGTVINGFYVESKIGQGGMGVVYKAKQLNLERYVALKVLSDELSKDAEFVERFFREARAAASLSHSNIVQVYDAGSTLDGIYYFAMELVEGETLDTKITRDGLIPPKDAIEIASKIAAALEYAWERQKLSHGDIKPDNIILNSSGGAKLADLGLAKSIHDEKAFKEGLMATPLYAPPEVIAGDVHRIDCHSDMYSFGATLYHMLAGIPPFMADDADAVMKKHLNEKHIPLIRVNKELSPAISNLVDHLIAKNPENRPSSWKEICKTLDKIHDAERKVFHKPVPVVPKVNPAPIHHHEVKAPDPLAKLIKSLVLFVVILSLLAVSVFFYLESRKKTVQPRSTLPVATSSSKPSPAEAINREWLKLKADMPKVDPEYGINLIQDFVKKHPSNVPADADNLLQELRQKLVSQQKAKSDIEKKHLEVQNEIKDLCGLLSSPDLAREQKARLEELNKRIETVLLYAGKDKDFLIEPGSKKVLNEGFLKVSDALLKIKMEEERVALQEEGKKEQERQEKERMRLAEGEKQRQDKLALNNLIDGYYLALGDFIASYSKKKDAAFLKELVDAWLDENKKTPIPESFLFKGDFLKNTLIPCEPGLYLVFEKNEAVFKGKPLPGTSKDLAKFDVERITDRAIKLMKVDNENGKIIKTGKSLQWDQIAADTILQSIQQRITNADSAIKLSKQDAGAILTFCVLNGMFEQFSEFIKAFTCFNAQEKKNWETICDDFRKAQDERKAIESWRGFAGLLKTGEIFEASHLLIDINNSFKNTDMFKRYSEEIQRQFLALQALLPELQALLFLDGAEQDLKNSKFIQALEKAMSANIRCGNMKNPHPSIKEKIKTIQDQCLAALSSSSSIKNISDNRIPFYYWEVETPGDAWIYEQVVRSSGKINNQELLSTMSVGSSIDIGNWSQALSTMNSAKYMDIDKLLSGVKGNMSFWVPSFMFAQGLISMNYADRDSQMSVLSGLNTMAEQFKKNPMGPMDTLTTALAIEYALMIHSPVKAHDMALAHQYNTGKPDREIRIALLDMLVCLQRTDMNKDEYQKALKKYNEQFKNSPELANDLNWCGVAAWILDDNKTLDPKRLLFLKESKCAAPDICARIMVGAVAKSFATTHKFESDRELYPLLEARISGNTVSGELWRQLAILKIARSGNNPNAMLSQVKESLNDSRFCAIMSYPKLCMMKAGLEVMSGKTSPKDAEKILKYILECSPMASASDKASIEVISSETPAAVVSKLLSENKVVSAYWCAILGIMTHRKDMKQVVDIEIAIEESRRFLTWDERLLLKVICE